MYRTFPHPVFDLHPHLMVFMQKNPFFAAISRQIRKVCTRDIPTAAVSYDTRTDELILWYNDLFMASLTVSRDHGILKHEFYHVVFRHLTARLRTPSWFWNGGADMSIDWLIWREAEAEAGVGMGMLHEELLKPLPEFAKTPGRTPWIFCPKTYRERPLRPGEVAARAIPFTEDEHGQKIADFDADPDVFNTREPTDVEKEAYALNDAIEKAPGNMTAEWYFDYLMKLFPPKGGNGTGPGGLDGDGGGTAGDGTPGGPGGLFGGSLDEHKNWDDIPEQLRERVENRIRSMIERAVREADTQSNGWGHIPAELSAMIRKSVSSCVDWHSLTQHFIGTVDRGRSRRSITVRDRKYGLMHPGLVVGHLAHIVVVIDQSGSVSEQMLSDFFAELGVCTRKLSVTILPFDADCRVEDAWEWKKGTVPDLIRTKCGGTDFDAPTAVINEHARAKGWEAAVFMTDGQCFKPGPCNIKRAWVIGPGCQIPDWLDDETVISMDESMPATGAWH